MNNGLMKKNVVYGSYNKRKDGKKGEGTPGLPSVILIYRPWSTSHVFTHAVHQMSGH
ncbi:hypothetical protein ACJQWK_09599 [Exserohilum turcicum]